MGSLRSHLVRQFLIESILVSVSSFVLSVGLAYPSLPYFNSLAGLQLSLPFGNIFFYASLLGCALLVGILAGLYPSFFLSAFQPVRVLKGQLALGGRSRLVRGGLVVVQFVISIFLIIGTITVNSQLEYIQDKKVGFSKDQVIMISDIYLLGEKAETFKNEVLKNTLISSGTLTGFVPVNIGWRNDNTFWSEGSQPTAENTVGMQNWTVDVDYLLTMKMTIRDGRGFSRDFPSDSSAVILNETAVRYFNFGDDPVGKRISMFGDNNPLNTSSIRTYTVIGVVEDFHYESMTESIGPLGLFLGENNGYASFRFNAGNTRDVITEIEKTWKTLATGQPFDYSFLDESFARMY